MHYQRELFLGIVIFQQFYRKPISLKNAPNFTTHSFRRGYITNQSKNMLPFKMCNEILLNKDIQTPKLLKVENEEIPFV